MKKADVAPSVRWNGLRALAGRQAQGLDHGLHGVLQAVPYPDAILVRNLSLWVQLFPLVPEVADLGCVDKVLWGQVNVLQWVLVLKALFLLVACAWINLLDNKVQGRDHPAERHGALWVREQDVRLGHDAIRQLSGRNGAHLLVILCLGQVDLDRNVFQDLLLDGIGHVELEHNVRPEDVLDASDRVLSLLLDQIHGLAALVKRSEIGKLRDAAECLLEVRLERQLIQSRGA
mmetsp:Transcript_3911/g.11316  ORF Transcript_3911/g.11316 Transcript_3911/m.11316 type:complete len:232 (-) Transcript_3911:1953-2648(-)